MLVTVYVEWSYARQRTAVHRTCTLTRAAPISGVRARRMRDVRSRSEGRCGPAFGLAWGTFGLAWGTQHAYVHGSRFCFEWALVEL